jgi:hypothetical protein
MPIGSSKLGVLGAGLVPGGTETFNAPGTFSIPPGVKKVNITGVGGVGNPGTTGTAGNAGEPGLGGGGGGGSIVSGPYPCNVNYQQGGIGGGIFTVFPPNPAGFSGLNKRGFGGSLSPQPAGNPLGQAGQSGCSGSGGSAGSAGCAGNPGQCSSGLGNNFAGGAGGNAGNAGAAGTGGSGGVGGARGPSEPTAINTNVAGGAGSGGGGSGVAVERPRQEQETLAELVVVELGRLTTAAQAAPLLLMKTSGMTAKVAQHQGFLFHFLQEAPFLILVNLLLAALPLQPAVATELRLISINSKQTQWVWLHSQVILFRRCRVLDSGS